MKGIFYNSSKSLCSIWESGKMCFDALKTSDKFSLDYSEEKSIDNSYDFIICNHHFTVNNWITEKDITIFNKPSFCVVTEITFGGSPIAKVPPFFHHYMILDSTIDETDKIHAFGRPLEKFDINIQPYIPRPIPKIGSFGFATAGKDWHKIVEAVQNEFDEAEIHFNIPRGDYIPESIHNSTIDEIRATCFSIIKKQGISLQITHNNFSKTELLQFCSQNTVNAFFYYREHIFTSGLAAVTDQAISAGRPLLVTSDKTFRHIHKYVDYYPKLSIKDCMNNTQCAILKLKEDWSQENFLNKFEKLLGY